MSLEVKGVLTTKKAIQKGTSQAGKEWQKLEFAITTQGDYPKLIAFSLFGDKTSLINNFKKDQQIKVSFNAESREYNDRFYTDLQAWKIEKAEQSVPSPQKEQTPPPEEIDDLPF